MGDTGTHSFDNLIRSDFWFVDGNIVIVAGNAVFKVHRGQLERHSEFFNGFFSIPQPTEQDLIDDCVYMVLPDDPSDVFYFLSALYDGLYFERHSPRDFTAISAVLRLSSKYFVEHLRKHCMNRLHHDWPTTLAGWDQREHEATDSIGHYLPREVYPHPVLVIQLALNLGIPSILPAAFYDLSRYGGSKILAGAVLPPLILDQYIHRNTDPPRKKVLTLTRSHFIRILRGREAAQRYVANFLATSLGSRKPSADCAYRFDPVDPGRDCQESFYFIRLNILRAVGGISCGRDADALFTLTQSMEMLSRTDFSDGQNRCGLRMCLPCKVDFAACAARAREEVWELLPSWFGLVDGAAATVLAT